MRSHAAAIGERIRFHRKKKGLTLEQLARQLYKSKSTLSKYESGAISPDVGTLQEIAALLDVSAIHLMEAKAPDSPVRQHMETALFRGADRLYAYHYDGRLGRTIPSLLWLEQNPNNGDIQVHCYLDVESFEQYTLCRCLYSGTLYSYDTVTYIFLQNQSNPMERISYCILNPLDNRSETKAILVGITADSLRPAALHAVLSASPLEEESLTPQKLRLTKKQLDDVKEKNMLMLE